MCAFGMTAFQTSAQQMVVSAWEQFFYDGDRLRSEVSLFGDASGGPHTAL